MAKEWKDKQLVVKGYFMQTRNKFMQKKLSSSLKNTCIITKQFNKGARSQIMSIHKGNRNIKFTESDSLKKGANVLATYLRNRSQHSRGNIVEDFKQFVRSLKSKKVKKRKKNVQLASKKKLNNTFECTQPLRIVNPPRIRIEKIQNPKPTLDKRSGSTDNQLEGPSLLSQDFTHSKVKRGLGNNDRIILFNPPNILSKSTTEHFLFPKETLGVKPVIQNTTKPLLRGRKSNKGFSRNANFTPIKNNSKGDMFSSFLKQSKTSVHANWNLKRADQQFSKTKKFLDFSESTKIDPSFPLEKYSHSMVGMPASRPDLKHYTHYKRDWIPQDLERINSFAESIFQLRKIH
ncbi:unnamed protein product [Moneuplotes crassus]|uniref:Uncharacterized protein n=1 Tax=Euplotes crassus TaxID=5936 RepID=A0AAD1X646_EUPCR|nr:unnamed protein product [Moneuplotes crassus]